MNIVLKKVSWGRGVEDEGVIGCAKKMDGGVWVGVFVFQADGGKRALSVSVWLTVCVGLCVCVCVCVCV